MYQCCDWPDTLPLADVARSKCRLVGSRPLNDAPQAHTLPWQLVQPEKRLPPEQEAQAACKNLRWPGPYQSRHRARHVALVAPTTTKVATLPSAP